MSWQFFLNFFQMKEIMSYNKKDVAALMFEFGPLHEKRYEIVELLKKKGLQTGDILYRASNGIGPFGIPFNRLVARITNSEYSHAAIVQVVNNEYYVLEINDQGTLFCRIIDWLDTCYTSSFAVYRLKEINSDLQSKINEQIEKVLMEDPDYDFIFSDPKKFYCTESVAFIYQQVGIQLIEPQKIKDVVNPVIYWILRIGSLFTGLFYEVSLSFTEKLYFVGNEKHGLMSSEKTQCIFHYEKSI